MENEATADTGGLTDIVERAAGGEGALSLRAAANSLVDTRRNNSDDNEPPDEARGRA